MSEELARSDGMRAEDGNVAAAQSLGLIAALCYKSHGKISFLIKYHDLR